MGNGISGSDKAELMGVVAVAIFAMLPFAAVASGFAVGFIAGAPWGVLTAFSGPLAVALVILLAFKFS